MDGQDHLCLLCEGMELLTWQGVICGGGMAWIAKWEGMALGLDGLGALLGKICRFLTGITENNIKPITFLIKFHQLQV